MTIDAPPRDYAELRARIVARRGALPKRLAQVAAFAVDNPDEIAFGTAASIATRADVQPSTLIRFSQAMGYPGFSDMQAVFRQHLRDRLPDYETRLEALSGTGSAPRMALLFDGFCDAGERSVATLRRSLDMGALEAVVDRLAAARTIYLIGLRRSFPLVSYMSYALGKLAVRHVLVDTAGGMAAEVAGFAEPADAVFAVSFTPYASETIALAGQAADRGVPLLAMTDSPFSPIAQKARAWLEVTEADVEGFRSLSASFALVMTLSVAVAERRREHAAADAPRVAMPRINRT